MAEVVRAVTWSAPEHHHIEKSADWYWALGIIAIAGSVASILFGNTLFGVVILLGASVMVLFALRKPVLMDFAVTVRGVHVGNELFPYSTLEAFYIDEHEPKGPQLLIRPNRLFMPLIIIPIPEEYIDEIDTLLAPRLREEHIEEPFSHKLMEFFGF